MRSCLILIAGFLGTSSAMAAQPFDGQWSMSASTQRGTCSSYSFDVSVTDGVLQTPPGVLVSGAGRVSQTGAVAINFSSGSDTIAATGKAKGTVASGGWQSPTLGCSGSWSAQRR